MWNVAPGAPGLASVSGDLRLSPSMYFTFAEQSQTFQSLGVWTPGQTTVTGLAEPERPTAAYISDGLLQTLGIPPVFGRWLTAEDQAPNGPDRVCSATVSGSGISAETGRLRSQLKSIPVPWKSPASCRAVSRFSTSRRI